MFKKLLKHITIALIFLILTLGQQYLFFYVKELPIVWLTSGKYVGVFAFLFLATFIRPNQLRFFFLSFVFLLNFFQMSHLSYFGTQILPNSILLFLTQFDEIKGTLLVEYQHVLLSFIFTIVPTFLGWIVLNKNKNIYGTKVIGIIFTLYLIYNPARTFITGNTWGRQPSTRELSGMNVYLSFSYFVGRILPYKINQGPLKEVKNASTELKLTPAKTQWDNIVVVLGESLSPHHMSLYGYEKPTTPFLLSQAKDPNFFSTIALSGGVSTDISVAFLLNMGFGEAGSVMASKGTHCVFKLAKKQTFTTHFISSQSAQQLRYIAPFLCASSLDNYQTLEDISPETLDHQGAEDIVMLPYLEKILKFDSKQFVVLHQRGSHGPWEMRSNPKHRIFSHDNKVGHYDNSVLEFDLFMKDLFSLIEKSKKKTLVIYLSDHGEALGQEGRWGHGQLIRPAFEIPLFVRSFHQDLPERTKKIPMYVPHYNISLFLADALGFSMNQDFTAPVKNYVIFGNDIDGFAGKAQISFKPDGTYNFKVVN
jgi:glucan phosphoethanolaminetransferase (alkaline phosphatase superfamily)